MRYKSASLTHLGRRSLADACTAVGEIVWRSARLIGTGPDRTAVFSSRRVASRRVALATMFHCVWQSASVCKRQGAATFCRTANTAYRHWSLRPTTIFRIAYYVRSFIHAPVLLTRATTWFLSLVFLPPSLPLSLARALILSLFLSLSSSPESALQSC